MPTRQFIVLTGASGSGKTTIACHCAELMPITVRHFDEIPIPSTEDMVRQFGSPEAWQHAKTLEWFERLAVLSDESVLFEGQSRIAFIQSAISMYDIPNARLILVDCDDNERLRRLEHHRRQPDLATKDMLDWAAYLRNEARAARCEILDTTRASVDESARRILHLGSERTP